jgi:hypothetical protein
MPSVLTVEDAILRADLLPPRPDPHEVERLGTVDRLAVAATAQARADLRMDVVRALLHTKWVQDERCGQAFTVLGYINHTATVQHEAGEVTALDNGPDERDLGRQGESKTAARS